MAYVFYDSFAIAPLLLPVWFLYVRDWIADMCGKKEEEFLGQFRDSIQAMASALKGGIFGRKCDTGGRKGFGAFVWERDEDTKGV